MAETPANYLPGSVKQDPDTLAVAVRTNVPEDPYVGHAWAVMTIDRGGHYAAWDDVSGWTDLDTASPSRSIIARTNAAATTYAGSNDAVTERRYGDSRCATCTSVTDKS